MHELAGHDGPVPELSTRTVTALTAQARLQVADSAWTASRPYDVVDAQPLMVLPDADKGDLFFDFEGDPLWTVDGREWGLEYLWGVLTLLDQPVAATTDEFHPFWAHDRASERQALVDFLAMVRKRRKRYPGMHIYHYAAYEKSTLLRLAGRYGVGEHDVDELLRNGILVDLYPLVRKSIRVGAESYSIKYLEPLYMGNELRSGEVTTATDSITQYARYCALRDEGRTDEAIVVLKDIEDYNRYDCRSTRRLRDWMMARAIESGVPPRGPQPVVDGGDVEPADDVERALLKFAGDGIDQRTAEQTAVAMVAAARGFHKREDKPFWWAHFDRVNNPVDEWADNGDVFIAEQAELVADWHQPPRARKPQRHVRLIGELANGDLANEMYALYDPPSPPGLADDPDRRAFGSVTVTECDNPEAPTEVIVVERQPKDGGVFDQLPFALTPGPPINTKPLQESIADTAAMVAAGLPNLPADAVTDVLLRRAPRTVSGGPLPHTSDVAADLTARALWTWTRRTSRCTDRLAPARRSPRPRSSHDSSTSTGGASAWSRSRTPSSRTCSVTSWPQGSTGRGSARSSTRSTRAGPSSPTPSSPASFPITTAAWSAERVGTSPTPTRFRGWRWICSSSRRPASTAWRTPSRWRRRPGT